MLQDNGQTWIALFTFWALCRFCASLMIVDGRKRLTNWEMQLCVAAHSCFLLVVNVTDINFVLHKG